MPRQSSRLKTALTNDDSSSPTSRPRRTAASTYATTSPVSHDSSGRKSLQLTIKMPSSRLREATSARDTPEAEPVSSSRATRNKPRKSYIMQSESDDEDGSEQEPGEEEEDDEVEVEEEEEEEEAEVEVADSDEEMEEDDDSMHLDLGVDIGDGDIDMDEDADDGLPLGAPLPPTTSLKIKGPAAPQPKVTVTPAKEPKPKSVEEKEMEMEDDDEELSELGSDEEPDENDDEDAEGDLDDEDDVGVEGRSPDAMSRASTPDVTKMTKRQRSRLDQVMGSDFLQLPMEPQIKKHFTPEEHAMRRAEMARRRKNLSEKRNEEEKADTINRLLKKQAPKRRGKISQAELEAQDRADDEEEAGEAEPEFIQPANPIYVRWVSNAEGCRVGVPSEWLGGPPVGRIFGAPSKRDGMGGKMVQEVEG